MSNIIGRPTNEALLAEGSMIKAKMCKICGSGACDEITQMILDRATGKQIIEKFGHLFKEGLTPTNIHSHKQHVNVDVAVKADREKTTKSVVGYSKATTALFQEKYEERFDKIAATDLLYKQRLENLFYLQNEIAEINQREKDNCTLSDMDMALRRKLVVDLENAYRGFSQDLIKHIQLDADLYTKQVSIQFIQTVQNSFLRFSQKMMDVLVKEIPDNLTRERLVDSMGELLESEVAPVLDPNKAIEEAESEIIKA